MRPKRLAWLGAVALVFVFTASLRPAAQAPRQAENARAGGGGTARSLLRTVDGQPDLQGVWSFATVTPLERPRELAGKEVLTEAEAVAFEKRQVALQNRDNRKNLPAALDVETAYNDFWWDQGTKVVRTRRTSLVIDPPDGQVPPMTPEAQQKAKMPRQRPVPERIVLGSVAEGPEDLGLSERCILGFSSGPPILPSAYNNNLQIFQAPGYVVIFTEMIHEARVVSLDGRPHLSQGVRQWLGDSRGKWQGETLVVETTNFTDKSAFSGNLIARGGSSERMRLVERFTRMGPDALIYEFTVDDPATWTKPWTAQVPMTRSLEKLYEYACHEGNYGMANLLSGARAVERATGRK